MVEHGRHREAAEVVLATLPSANAVLANALRGISDAWDKCEADLYAPKLITGLAIQLFRCLEKLGVEADSDVWEQLSQELSR